MIAGQRVRGTFDTQAAAEAFEHDCRAAAKLGKPLPDPPSSKVKTGTIGAICELTAEKHWKGAKSEKKLIETGQLFVRWCGSNMPADEALTEDRIGEYVEHLADECSLSGATINRRLAAVSKMARVARKQRLLPDMPEIPWQEEGEGRIRYFEPNELADIHGRLKQWGMDDWSDLFTFLADTGARVGEAERLTWRDVHQSTVQFVVTKGGKPRAVPTSPAVRELLARLRKRYGTTYGPFSWMKRHTMRHVWSRLRADLDWMGPDTVIHTFRHTCASRLAIGGAELFHIQRWMGHGSQKMTDRYAHLMPKHLEHLVGILS